MKKVWILLFLSLVAVVAYADKYDDWLNQEVKAIITKSEHDSFKALKTDAERDQFIKDFWAKRGTAYHDQYMQKVAKVNEVVPSKKHKGIESDMGQTLILLGQPDEQKTPDAKKRPSGGSDDDDDEEGPASGPQKKWVYNNLPKSISPTPVEVTFEGDPSTGEWRFTDKKKMEPILELARDYELSVAQQKPAQAQQAQQPQQAMPAQPVAPTASAVSTPSLKSALDAAAAGNGPKDVPFDAIVDSFMTSKGETFETVAVSSAADLSAAHVGIRVMDSSGAVEKEMEVPFANSSEKPGYFQAEVGVPPGEHKVAIGVSNTDKAGAEVKTLSVTDYGSAFALSSIIVSKGFDQLTEAKPEKEPYTFGKIKVHPSVDRVFAKSDTLILAYEIYNAQVDPATQKPNLEAVITFQKGSDKPQSAPAAAPNGLITGKKMTVPTSFPLANFPAGTYKLSITVTDKIANKTASSETNFTIK